MKDYCLENFRDFKMYRLGQKRILACREFCSSNTVVKNELTLSIIPSNQKQNLILISAFPTIQIYSKPLPIP